MTRERPASETGAPSAATVAKLNQAERALALRLEGHPVSAICADLGLERREVVALMGEGLEEWRRDRVDIADEYVALTLARYERLLSSVWAEAIGEASTDEEGGSGRQGRKDARMVALAILKAERELLGLDAEPEPDGDHLGDEVAAFVSRKLDPIEAEWEPAD